MALSLKGIGQGIGRGFKRAGRWVGDEVGRFGAPIVSAIEGDWRGAASGLGRSIKRAGQAGALLGKDKLAGVDVDILGAGGGAIEGGLGPSDIAREYYGDTGEGGFAGALSGGAKGYGGVKGAQAVHNIGERLGINQRLGALTDKAGITSPESPDPNAPLIRQEGETDEAFLDRQRTHTFNQTLANRDRRPGGRALAEHDAIVNDPRTVKIGNQYVGGQYGPDLRPGSFHSGAVDQMISEEGARAKANLEKFQFEIDPETGLPMRSLPDTPAQLQGPDITIDPVVTRDQAAYAPRVMQDPGLPDPIRRGSVPAQPRRDNTPYGLTEAERGDFLAKNAPTRWNQQLGIPGQRFDPDLAPVAFMQGPAGGAWAEQRLVNPLSHMEITYPQSINPMRLKNIGSGTTGGGNGGDPKSLWRKGLDYAGDNPDVVISALGDMFSGDSGMNEYYRRMAGVQERAQALREKQDEYESDRERLREQFLLRGSTSRWA